MKTPQNAIEKLAMWLPRMPTFAVVIEFREEVLDAFPLAILEFVAM